MQARTGEGASMKHDPTRDGCDTLPRAARLWHGTYCRWYDHREAGHAVRAGVWGWIADRIARIA